MPDDRSLSEEDSAGPGDSSLHEVVLAPGSRGRFALRLAGFVVGIGLLAWIVQRALSGQQFAGLSDAPWWQFALLLACTLTSVLANGAIFWSINALLRSTQSCKSCSLCANKREVR